MLSSKFIFGGRTFYVSCWCRHTVLAAGSYSGSIQSVLIFKLNHTLVITLLISASISILLKALLIVWWVWEISGCMLSTVTPAKTALHCILSLTRNRHCGNEQKRLEMLLSYSIWLYTYVTACTLREHTFFYFTEFTWPINKSTGTLWQGAPDKREANRTMIGFPQPFIPGDCVSRECSHSLLRLPGCHHVTVSVWSQSLWCGCLFQ